MTIHLVLALYSKGGGKNGKHTAVPQVSNVVAISYAGVQVFQQMHHRHFRPVTSVTAAFGTKQFLLLPSTSLLCCLSANLRVQPNNFVEIHMEELCIYDTLAREVKKLEVAMKMFMK